MKDNHLCAGYKELKEAYEKVVQERDRLSEYGKQADAAYDQMEAENAKLQQRVDEQKIAIDTVLRWCHANIESQSEVTTFCIQVRDLFEALKEIGD